MIEKILTAFKKNKIKFAICGGYAVVIHGVVRGTMDLDVVVDLNAKHLAQVEKVLKDLGFVSRIPVTAKEICDFREEYIKNRNLLAWSFYNPKNPLEVIDIIIVQDLKEVEVEQKNYHGFKIKVLTIDALIKMKSATDRPQDQADVDALRKIKSIIKRSR